MESRYPEHTVFCQQLRKFLQEEVSPFVNSWEEQKHFPNEIFRKLGDAGYLGLLISEDFGGVHGGYELASAWCEVFGEVPSVGFTVAVNMHALVISHALDLYGTQAAKEQYLTKSVTGEYIGAYAFTEPGAGSDLASLRTKAEKHGDRWIVNGSKIFITNGARARYVLVLARTDPSAGYNGFSTFLVDTTSPGFSVSKKLEKLGWFASDTALITFDNVEVPEECIIGKLGEGWMQASKNLNWERMMLTLTTLGGARACFNDTLRYCKERVAFGKPLLHHAAVGDTLLQMSKKIREAESLSSLALQSVIRGDESKAIVSAAKRTVCNELVTLCDHAIQLHGGYGYTTAYSPERWWRDLRLMPIGGGTSEVMANIVIKELGI